MFLKSLERDVKAITKEFKEPDCDEETWSESTTKAYDANAKATYALVQALNDDDIYQLINNMK